jgi:hypothetical protein
LQVLLTGRFGLLPESAEATIVAVDIGVELEALLEQGLDADTSEPIGLRHPSAAGGIPRNVPVHNFGRTGAMPRIPPINVTQSIALPLSSEGSMDRYRPSSLWC